MSECTTGPVLKNTYDHVYGDEATTSGYAVCSECGCRENTNLACRPCGDNKSSDLHHTRTGPKWQTGEPPEGVEVLCHDDLNGGWFTCQRRENVVFDRYGEIRLSAQAITRYIPLADLLKMIGEPDAE